MNGWPVFRDVTALLLQCYRQQYSVIVWILLFETINLRESGESEKLEDCQNLRCFARDLLRTIVVLHTVL